MQKSFTIQPEMFVCAAELDHPTLHALEDAEALLEWLEIEGLLSSIQGRWDGASRLSAADPVSGSVAGSLVSFVGCATVALSVAGLTVSQIPPS